MHSGEAVESSCLDEYFKILAVKCAWIHAVEEVEDVLVGAVLLTFLYEHL